MPQGLPTGDFPPSQASNRDVLDAIPLRFIVGTTASGKTGLALRLAEHPRVLAAGGLEIVSLDSMNLYRGLDIGTAKPSAEERSRVPHHLVDVAGPEERFDLQRYLQLVRTACEEIVARGALPLFVGGTGLYLAAILRGLFEGPPADLALRQRLLDASAPEGAPSLHDRLREVDPGSAERIHPNDTRRTIRALEVWEQTGETMTSLQAQWNAARSPRERRARMVGLHVPVDALDGLIAERTEEMLAQGWPEEALALEEAGGLGDSASQALGYDTALALAQGEITREEAARRIVLRTRQFARRQRTWYRKFEIDWLDAASPDLVEKAFERLWRGE
ncbi:IPP transferase [Planctomycetes bacterium Poly30]|uniref:tRNA dimethylallyltransferase n=1 Tax=Saltatorellus ferox TaxID=2528018 RepID=A0A518ES26_9BACT|nr:IPP transferase [Planctomycetes bacterium Poly30]